MEGPSTAPRGRGAAGNPRNRFERLHVDRWEADPEADLHEAPPDRVDTRFFKDSSRSLIATNDSPDIPFDASVNPYRGCEHGCIYCYARPFHEFLGFSAGLDFETRILVKEDAPRLLARELGSPRWKPKLLALSGVTDPYQPVEKRLRLTRGCLEVLTAHRNPVGVITKNALVSRDVDLLTELAGHDATAVTLSVTHLDPTLSARLEPRASSPRRRLAAVRELAAAGVPVGVNVAPIIPGLTDHEVPAILEAAAEAGASYAGYTLLRLPGAVEGLFVEWLETHYPERRDKVLERVRSIRGGRLNDPRFGHRFRGGGVFAEQVRALFDTTCRRLGLARRPPRLSTAAFRRPGEQLGLF